MRYDKISKLKMEDVKCTKYGSEFVIRERCKNSLEYRWYKLRRWPGSAFSACILMDPIFAFSAWLTVRGEENGFLFCNTVGEGAGTRFLYRDQRPRKAMNFLMRERFSKLGLGTGVCSSHTVHSPKRGCMQLLRFLGCKGTYIMQWFHMTDLHAYLHYTELANVCGGTLSPDFTPTTAMKIHGSAQFILEKLLDLDPI